MALFFCPAFARDFFVLLFFSLGWPISSESFALFSRSQRHPRKRGEGGKFHSSTPFKNTSVDLDSGEG